MHTDRTLDTLDETTTTLGRLLRLFVSKTCSAFQTRELPKEQASRGRRRAAAAAAKKAGKRNTKGTSNTQTPNTGLGKFKIFNLQTYKLHSLGDYVRAIRHFGTTDSYSTQIVSLIFTITQLSSSVPTGRARASSSKAVLCSNQQEQYNTTNCSVGTP